ncbi:MAG TPA: SNF2-related protein [Chthoniobacteraceae bacterium]|nr:SNF2-related protein [Chthoniobacteraceae bacterium]
MAVELTERLLMEAGGWEAVKHARALVSTGRVISAAYAPPLLKGLVREADRELRAGLKISSPTNIENICPCRPSREWGTICAHSLAVGVAVLHLRKTGTISGIPERKSGETTAGSPARPENGRGEGTSARSPGPSRSGPFFVEEGSPGVTGGTVRLNVVLPPQPVAAWERGQLTVGIEAERSGRKVLLNALDPKTTYACSGHDLRLIKTLQQLLPGQLSGMLALGREQALTLFDGLQGHPRVTLGRSTAVHFSAKPLRPPLEAKSDPLGRLLLHVAWNADTRLLIAAQKAWAITGTTFAAVAPGLPVAYFDLLRRDITLPAEQAAPFLANELPLIGSFFEVSGNAVGGDLPRLVPEEGRFSLYLEGSLNHLTARLQRIYSRSTVTVGLTSPSENWAFPDPADPSRILCRHLEAEREALGRLTRCGFTGPDGSGQFVLKGERAILSFFAGEYPQLEREWEVKLGTRFGRITEGMERITPRVEISGSGESWFDLEFDLTASSGERFSAADVQRFLQMGQNHVRLKNGKVALLNAGMLDDFKTVLRDCNPQQQQPGRYRIGQAQAAYLASSVAEAGFDLRAPASWRHWAQRQGGTQKMEPVALGDLEPVLRHYQKEGVSWLCFLGGNGLGGILADDMGLGKTLQALAYLRTQPGPSLVVCPSSLLFNWQREVEQFTSERRLLVIEGPGRGKLFSGIHEADLVLTSYPLLRRDAEKYRGIGFNTVILDEAQHIKNPDTQNAQSAAILRAQRKFILTGTPVENSVRDIWSLMNFVMPGYLGDRDDFRERYEIPIARHQSKEALGRLSRRLRPFLLRRRKQEVATDLPGKIEQVAYCELNTRQREVYAALLAGARAKVEEAHGLKEAGRAHMLMLTALLRLRQAACDLRLLEKGNEPSPAGGKGSRKEPLSGKLELFLELLQTAMDGGHRVLVFSQFVSMLSLLRRELEAQGVEYAYLDGQTKNRGEVVDRFQSGQAPVFLISLKAGGVGLNLTAADTVIHFDPWWNPAVEAQATDRAHRIGQKNVVTAYKLIARGTVEEKILSLQRKKREIIDATVENEEQPLMEGLTTSEIESLLME